MIDVDVWSEAASELAAEGFCMLMCLDRGAGAPLELWLRTNAGSVLVTTVSDSPVPSVSHVWPEAVMKEREIHEMFSSIRLTRTRRCLSPTATHSEAFLHC